MTETDVDICDDICIQFSIGSIFIQDTKGLSMTEGLFVWAVFCQRLIDIKAGKETLHMVKFCCGFMKRIACSVQFFMMEGCPVGNFLKTGDLPQNFIGDQCVLLNDGEFIDNWFDSVRCLNLSELTAQQLLRNK